MRGSYTYDSLGNIRQKNLEKNLGARTVNMSYTGLNRLSSYTDTAGPDKSLSYDNRGALSDSEEVVLGCNVTQLGGLFFTYDYADQPSYISGTATGSYKYDGNKKPPKTTSSQGDALLRARVKSVVNGKTIYNVYDASGALVHIDAVSDNKKTDYIAGGGMSLARISNNVVTYLHNERHCRGLLRLDLIHRIKSSGCAQPSSKHLGSVAAGTDAAGTLLWTEHHSPYGEPLSPNAANDNEATFTGHIRDKATGLNYMQARYYDPVIGRFLSIDPVTFMDTGDPNFFNRYAYAFNNPINLIDPTGMAPGDKFETPDEAAKDFADHVDTLEKNDGRQKIERGADIREDKETGEFFL